MRTDQHVAPERMKQLADGTLHPVKAREAWRHLMAGCAPCLALARALGIPTPAEPRPCELTESRLKLMLVLAKNDVDVELRRGAADWRMLQPLTPGQRLLVLKDNREMHHWGLYKHVLDACADAVRSCPIDALDMAFFSLAAVAALDPACYGAENIADFRAAALAALGNAKRHCADFGGAGEAFRTAHESILQGTGDPYEHANVICHEALLLRDLGEFEEALGKLDKAYKLYRRVNDIHLCGRTIIQQAATIGYVDPLQGVELCRRGLAMIDPSRGDHYLELSAHNLLAFFLNDAGYVDEARALHEADRHLYAQYSGAVTVHGAMLWLDGLIARSAGEYAAAESALRELSALYETAGFQFEQVMVSLDLAEVFLWSNRPAQAADLLRETYPKLFSWGLEKDVLALWLSLENFIRFHVWEAASFFRDVANATRRRWNRNGQTSPLRGYPL